MAKRPLIGITASEQQPAVPTHSVSYTVGRPYVRAIEDSDGTPLIVPPGLSSGSLRGLFDRLDGLLLSGGGDIDPTRFGQSPHPAVRGVSQARDQDELCLAAWAIQAQKPILAICRGIQVLNVALGGTLIQDIPSQVTGALQHSFDGNQLPHAHIAHSVSLEAGSSLAAVMGASTAMVNSWHHQSIQQPAGPLRVTAYAPDGIIEGVECPGHRFALGVQWHPEHLYRDQPEMKRLFAALVEAAASA